MGPPEPAKRDEDAHIKANCSLILVGLALLIGIVNTVVIIYAINVIQPAYAESARVLKEHNDAIHRLVKHAAQSSPGN